MAVVYVKEQGAIIQKLGERIVVTKGGQRLLDLPAIHLDNIAIIGNVQVTTQALHMLMMSGIDVSYLTYSGKFIGTAAAESSKNIFLRFEQYKYYLDDTKRLEMARTIIRDKIQNQIEMIRAYRNKDLQYDWDNDIAQMVRRQSSLVGTVSSSEIMGIEGLCSNIYFGAFSHMIDCDFVFTGRNRRPPRDPINVILSLAYTFLTKEVSNALDSESFEPYLGFLHGIRYGRKSLSLDIVEQFRQPVVDRFVILIFNKRMIGKYDFEYDTDGKPVLTENGFKKFCTEYERWMTGKNSIAGCNSFRSLIRNQIAALKVSIKNSSEYKPYIWSKRECT